MLRFIRNFFRNFKEYILLIILLVISLLFLSLNNDPKIKNLKRIALGGFAFLNSAAGSITDLFNDEDEYIELKKKNAELMLKVNQLREYGLENNELRRLLEFKEETDFKLRAGKIISELVSKAQGSFIINIGSEDSIKVGMPVLNELGIIGIITDVSEEYSMVRTLHNSSLKITVTDQRSSVDGILSWNGISLIISNIPTTYDVKIGDRFITSEFSTIFPPSIPVGLVTRKETNISGLLSNITIEPFVDLTSIKNVFVLMVIQSDKVDELELNLFKR